MATRLFETFLSLLLSTLLSAFRVGVPRPARPQVSPGAARLRAQMIGW